MKHTLSVGALLCAALTVASPLRAADTAQNAMPDLQGKTIAIATSEPASMVDPFGRMSFGGGKMTVYSITYLTESPSFSPTSTLRDHLATLLRERHGAILLPADAKPTKPAARTKKIAKAHPNADYVLDVFNGMWWYSGYPGDHKHALNRVHFGVRLIDVRTGKPAVERGCQGSTENKFWRPTPNQLLGNDGKLARAYAMSIAWDCLAIVAPDFRLPLDVLPVRPDEYKEPLAFLVPERFRNPAPTAAPMPAPPTTTTTTPK